MTIRKPPIEPDNSTKRARRTGAGGGHVPIAEGASLPVPAFFSDLRPVDGSPDIPVTVLRTLAALIFNAYDDLTERAGPFRISTKVLRPFVGAGHGSTDQLRAALHWLSSSRLGVPGARRTELVDLADEPLIRLRTTDVDGHPVLVSGIVEYALSESARRVFALGSPGERFVRLELDVPLATRSVPVMRLYLLLARYYDRREPVLQIPVHELCDKLGLSADSAYRKLGGALKAKVIKPTLDLIERLSVMRVLRVEYATAGQGGRIDEILFEVARKREKGKATPATVPARQVVGYATGALGLLSSLDVFLGDLPKALRFHEDAVRGAFAPFVAAVRSGAVQVDPCDNEAVWEAFDDFLIDREENRLMREAEARGPLMKAMLTGEEAYDDE